MDKYVELASKTVESFVTQGRVLKLPDGLPDEMLSRKAGVFVTIFSNDELRGCIGTFAPTRQNIAEEIIDNAILACSRDYRFEPVWVKELPNLTYEVSILEEPKPVNNFSQLNPKEDGLIVKAGNKTGLLLPDVEGVNSIDQQFSICCEKGNINPESEKTDLYTFRVEKHT